MYHYYHQNTSVTPPLSLQSISSGAFWPFVKLNLACVFDFSLVSVKDGLFCGKTVAKVIESKIVGVLSLYIRINFVFFIILLKP